MESATVNAVSLVMVKAKATSARRRSGWATTSRRARAVAASRARAALPPTGRLRRDMPS